MSNNFEEDKKKILDEQEKDFAKDKDSSQPLLLTDELKAKGVELISFSDKYLYVDSIGNSVHTNLHKDSISKTLEYFENLVNGTFNDSLKKAIKLFITEIWDEKIKDNRTSGNGEGDTDKSKEKSTKAELVIPRIKPHIHQLFIDEYDVPHAGITIDNHVEVLRLDSRRFKNWMARQMYLKKGYDN